MYIWRQFLGVERIGNAGTPYFLYALLAEVFGTCVHRHSEETCTRDNFFSEIMNQIVY